MIKVSVLYPHIEGVTFDMRYYCESHIPMVLRMLGSACAGASVEQGMSGGEGGAPLYIAMGHLYFESFETFAASFPIHTANIMADVPNYTSITPLLQISEVKMM